MFCPLISTPEEDVECKEGCRFRFIDIDDAEHKCEINYIADKIDELEKRLTTIEGIV